MIDLRDWEAQWESLSRMCRVGLSPGKKQDLWYVVDPLTGEKQQTLTSSFAEMLCPSSSLLYLGRTGTRPLGTIPCRCTSDPVSGSFLCFHAFFSRIPRLMPPPPEYTITMYDTKSRELRWNATYSDYASTLPDDDNKYSKGLATPTEGTGNSG